MYHITYKSSNSKTGPIPVTTSHRGTCPDACPLKRNGCYADHGPSGLHWNAVSSGKRGDDWPTFVAKVAAIEGNGIWRHNQAGDLPGDGDVIDGLMLNQLVRANAGKQGFTYTHKPMTPANAAEVAWAVKQGFAINLSADTIQEADELAAMQIAPVVVVLPENAPASQKTPGNRVVVVCPAQTHDHVTCSTCRMCAKPGRRVIIGFRAHGTQKAKAEAVCQGGAR